MKTLFICGDSFASPDNESPVVPWFELLAQALGPQWQVVNHSMVCASNLHIRLQVQSAIDQQADFVIMLATSSTRGEGRLTHDNSPGNSMLQRFKNVNSRSADNTGEFACYSYNSLDETCIFDAFQMTALENFRDRVFDLELSILNNQFIIESALHALKSNGIDFVFDQGGFEHPKFSDSKKHYFKEFDLYRGEINLWSLLGNQMSHRPYFHITDQSIHQDVSKYYFAKITHNDQS